MRKIWQDENGGITLEWIFILVVLVIGIIGTWGIMRDALIVEAGETADAVLKLDAGYSVQAPPTVTLTGMKGGGEDLQCATLYGFRNESRVAESSITAEQN